MLEAIVERFAYRWTRFTTNPYANLDAICWLPAEPAGLDAVRAWHGIGEIAHGEARLGRPGAAVAVANAERDELEYVDETLGLRLGRPATLAEARFLQGNVAGIRTAMAADVTPISLEEARCLLLDTLNRLSLGDPQPAGGPTENRVARGAE